MPNRVVVSKLGGPEVLKYENYDLPKNVKENIFNILKLNKSIHFAREDISIYNYKDLKSYLPMLISYQNSFLLLTYFQIISIPLLNLFQAR